MFAADLKDADTYQATLSNLVGVSGIILPVGMILVGIATVRAGRWPGWRRYVPLACDVYVVVLIPLLFSSIDKLGIAGFCFAFLILSYAVFTRPEAGTGTFVGAPSAAGPRRSLPTVRETIRAT